MQKYGQGEVSIRKCDTCNFEKKYTQVGSIMMKEGVSKCILRKMNLVVLTVMRMSLKVNDNVMSDIMKLDVG